jgi:F-type H+-transporting ATPase subunit b
VKRLLLALLLFSFTAFGSSEAEEHGGDPMIVKKWINFAILAGGLGYLAIKFGGPAMRSQQKRILESIEGAAHRAEEAEARAAEIDRKVAGLESELVAMREQARAEMSAETARFEDETRAQLDKIRRQAESDIAAARAEAIGELKAHAARLAVELARQKIEARMTPETQSRLVARFTEGIGERTN